MNRIILRTTTAVAAVTAAALLFPSVATAAPGTLLSTAAKTNGWEIPFDDEKGQEAIHSADVVTDADGSLKFETTDTAIRKRLYHSANVKLSSIVGKPLSFEQTGSGLTWQIRVTGAATENAPGEDGFATLVWDAPAGDGARTVTVPADSALWRSTRDLPGIPKNTQKTFAELAAAAGTKTKVTHYGILLFSGSPTTAHVDHVTFNGTTTNFALNAPSGNGFGSVSDLIPLP